MAGPPIPYQVKKRKLFQTKLKNYLKNQLLFKVHQMKVNLFLVFLLGTKKI